MTDSKDLKRNDLIYYFFQLGIWLVILILIFMRGFSYKQSNSNWIWIINYIGMSIAILNLFIDKCFKLKKVNSKKYKPFVGFTVCLLIALCFLSLVVFILQNKEYNQTVNDVITLLALFFSLSRDVWAHILCKISKKIA